MTSPLKKLNLGAAMRKRRLVAVDVDGRILRLVLIHPGNRQTRIDRMLSLPLPDDVEPTDAQAIGRFLGQALRDLKFRGAGLLMSVPRGQAVLKPLSLPPGTPREEMPSMVRFQVDKELPFRPEEAVIDFAVESHFDAAGDTANPHGIDVLAAAVRLPVVDYYRKLAEAAGASLLRLGLRPYANVCCLRACQADASANLALVHLSGEEAEIDVLAGESMALSRSVGINVPASPTDQQKRSAATALAIDVVRSLQGFEAIERSSGIERIIVAGGTGLEDQLVEELSRRSSRPCQRLDVIGGLGLNREVQSAGAFVPALGLSLGHGRGESLPFDFLNPKRPPVHRDTRKTRMQVAALIAMLALLGAVLGMNHYLGQLDAANAKLSSQYSKLEDESKKVRSLGRQVGIIDAWVGQDRQVLDHLTQLSRLLPSNRHVYIGPLSVTGEGRINFVAYATGEPVLTRMRQTLEEAGYVVETRQVTLDQKNPHGYTFRCDTALTIGEHQKVDLAGPAPVHPTDELEGYAVQPTDERSLQQPPEQEPQPVAAAPQPQDQAPDQQGDPTNERRDWRRSSRGTGQPTGSDGNRSREERQRMLERLRQRRTRR
jgi:Tfp pilus assembly PilM family ATPase